jgi:hypothetical protein
MPALPPDARQASDTTGSSHGVTAQPSSVGQGQAIAALTSSLSGNIERRLERLEEFMSELKGLSSLTTNSYQSSHSSDTTSLAPATKRKRTVNVLDELEDQSIPFSSFRFDDQRFMPLSAPTGDSTALFFPLEQSLAHGTSTPTTESSDSQLSMQLKNCARGKCFLPLPDEGYTLLSEFLQAFNSTIPLFHPETLYNHVRDCYSGVADKMPLRWVLTYIALAIGHRLRAMSLFAVPEDDTNAEWYLNKCINVMPDLLLQEPSLELIQGLLGAAVLLHTSCRAQKAILFSRTASSLAQDLGFNEAPTDLEMVTPEKKQETYVFWIAFLMDTAMSLRANRPTTQRLVDISAPLPSLRSPNWWNTNDSDGQLVFGEGNIFAFHASLALIQAEALDELFSIKARQRSASLTTDAFNSVISKLKNWRKTGLLADKDASSRLKSTFQSDVAHALVLEAFYFETIYQLHAAYALCAFTRRMGVLTATELITASRLTASDIYADGQRLLEFAAALIPHGNLTAIW